MSRDDQLRQALDGVSRLARDTWQIKDGRVILDTPAKHILIKSTEQFMRMLERRSYTVQQTGEEECRVVSDSVGYSFGYFLYHTVAEVAEWFDKYLAQGWKHMQCIQCGTPLLASFKYVETEESTTPWYGLKWYGVCSVQAGPYTEHLKVCPGCGIEFTGERGYPPPLRGIDDVGEEEARNAH